MICYLEFDKLNGELSHTKDTRNGEKRKERTMVKEKLARIMMKLEPKELQCKGLIGMKWKWMLICYAMEEGEGANDMVFCGKLYIAYNVGLAINQLRVQILSWATLDTIGWLDVKDLDSLVVNNSVADQPNDCRLKFHQNFLFWLHV